VKILNLYAGVGGNRKKWGDEHQVTAVEYDPKIAEIYQRLHPEDTVLVADAHEYLINHFHEYDMIWSSPPCPTHSQMSQTGANQTPRYPDMSLYQEIILLQHQFQGLWVVENVKPYYSPLLPETFRIGRHLFWSNFFVGPMEAPSIPALMKKQKTGDREKLHDWLGIYFDHTVYVGDNHCPVQVLRNCCHPDVGEHILNWALGSVKDQHELFELNHEAIQG
jgi:DNA (cytosine-5)-methyltransferase 1